MLFGFFKNIALTSKLVLLVLVFTFGILLAHAEWSQPVSAPTDDNSLPPVHEGSEAQVKGSDLIVENLLTIGYLVFEDYFIVGDSVAACDASKEGSLRYDKDAGTNCLQLCGDDGADFTWGDLVCNGP